jgi:hypothetical protein
MILRIRTTLRGALDKLPATAIAWMIDEGWLETFPLELTKKGRRYVQLVFLRRRE